MPGRNIVKEYAPESYYHVYSRGVAKQPIFLNGQDYSTFLSLLKRYLGSKKETSRGRGIYPNYREQVELLSFCLMGNHVHLLIYQSNIDGMSKLMKSVMTSYSMYFNRKYKRVGPVFQSRYRASRINQDEYLEHISRYIHLNPREWESYPYSSFKYYRGEANSDWINPDKILQLFPDVDQYIEFMRDYEGHKSMLDEISWDLADN